MLPGLLAAALLAASPESMTPEAALAALDRFGQPPDCAPREVIVTLPGGDHGHRFQKPEPQKGIAGHAKELVPFTRHSDRRVVLRAARLLCFEGSAAATETLLALHARWPCERELAAAAWALGSRGEEEPSCLTRANAPPALFAPSGLVRAWTEPEDAVLKTALLANQPAAWTEVRHASDLMDQARARAVVRTAAAVDTPASVRALFHAAYAASGNDWRGRRRDFLVGPGLLALEAMAARSSVTPAVALIELVHTARPEDAEVFADLENSPTPALVDLATAVDAALARTDGTPTGRALLEALRGERRSGSDDWMARQTLLRQWEEVRDRPALRAYVRDEKNSHAARRDAARVLAKLSDPTGLVLWQSRAGLPQSEVLRRTDDLDALLREATGPAYDQAKRLRETVWK